MNFHSKFLSNQVFFVLACFLGGFLKDLDFHLELEVLQLLLDIALNLLMLFLFLYSVLGVEWFAVVKLQGDVTIHANFRTFMTAASTLFRMATGEGWQAIMYDCARPLSVTFECVDKPEYKDMYDEETGEMDI